jgi:hypothetical protein
MTIPASIERFLMPSEFVSFGSLLTTTYEACN